MSNTCTYMYQPDQCLQPCAVVGIPLQSPWHNTALGNCLKQSFDTFKFSSTEVLKVNKTQYYCPTIVYLKFSDDGIKFLVPLCALCESLHGLLKTWGVVRVELQEWGQVTNDVTKAFFSAPGGEGGVVGVGGVGWGGEGEWGEGKRVMCRRK